MNARTRVVARTEQVIAKRLARPYCVVCGAVGEWKPGIWISIDEQIREGFYGVCSDICYRLLDDARWLCGIQPYLKVRGCL